MSLFSDPTDLNAYGRGVAQLLLIGGVQLERLARGPERVTFKAWAEAVREDADKRGAALAAGQVEWLWDAHGDGTEGGAGIERADRFE